jgi:hypothetical protein
MHWAIVEENARLTWTAMGFAIMLIRASSQGKNQMNVAFARAPGLFMNVVASHFSTGLAIATLPQVNNLSQIREKIAMAIA